MSVRGGRAPAGLYVGHLRARLSWEVTCRAKWGVVSAKWSDQWTVMSGGLILRLGIPRPLPSSCSLRRSRCYRCQLAALDDEGPHNIVRYQIGSDEHLEPEHSFTGLLGNGRHFRCEIRPRLGVAGGVVVAADATTAPNELTDQVSTE